MIKSDTLNASKHGEDFQNLLLFFGREHILSVMYPIVRPISATKQCVHTLAGLGLLPVRQSPPARFFTKHIKNFGKGTQ